MPQTQVAVPICWYVFLFCHSICKNSSWNSWLHPRYFTINHVNPILTIEGGSLANHRDCWLQLHPIIRHQQHSTTMFCWQVSNDSKHFHMVLSAKKVASHGRKKILCAWAEASKSISTPSLKACELRLYWEKLADENVEWSVLCQIYGKHCGYHWYHNWYHLVHIYSNISKMFQRSSNGMFSPAEFDQIHTKRGSVDRWGTNPQQPGWLCDISSST